MEETVDLSEGGVQKRSKKGKHKESEEEDEADEADDDDDSNKKGKKVMVQEIDSKSQSNISTFVAKKEEPVQPQKEQVAES